ncbi:methylmalonyl-CoA mutase family protein [Rhodococcoides corynebacterioides]|uniref:methylmalonyl-CoA mutase family protein n=1 Tax=Rhodococcoides corynebacterioides TaxID=53972 RepID=UPI001C9ADBD2|nr:methylmalonyl-CoA mutase family protein [Rhodococcus corynebacterioides]MBY6364966.1 methylmalonyl-CoA mutase [Rhodococcus corynebacterioides]
MPTEGGVPSPVTSTDSTDPVGAEVPVRSAEDGFAAWREAVAGVLAKSRRVDRSELPDRPETLLDTTTYDGVTISPLYGPLDEQPEPPLPGHFPYVRGGDRHRDVHVGWRVAGRYGRDDADAATVNTRMLDGLQNGVSALWLSTGVIGAGGVADALTGVLLDLAPLTVDAGADLPAVADAVFDVLPAETRVTVSLGAAPLTDAVAEVPTVSLENTVALARRAAADGRGVRAITVDGTVFHDAGAADGQEIGLAVAAGLEYVRALVSAGATAAEALSQLEFRFAATDQQFETIAKFRAARRVWARVAQVLGAPDHGAAPQHAVTSAAMMTQRDPWVNMLRTTLAVFGAGVGGADTVTVLPFDVALPGGAPDVSETFAARIARNTQLLLLEESHLGRVLDPAGGSWYVESLTDATAEAAWTVFQSIERAGGYRSALDSGEITRTVAETRAAREQDIAHRRTSVTGVNEFPNLQEPPVTPGDGTVDGRPVARYAAAFEALRDRGDAVAAERGSRPVVLLAPLGSVAEHNARTTFAANLMASGGIEALNPGANADLAAVAAETGSPVAIVCGTDKRYAEDGPAAVRALRDAGVTTVLLAGKSSTFPSDTDGAALPDGDLTLSIDAVAELSRILDLLTGADPAPEGQPA